MPEYSSTTLTPSDSTQVPGMQGSNAGNFQLNALKAYILAEKAQANGLASLDATGKLVSSQIPDNLDDVLVYGSYALLPATGVEGKIYITADTNSMYRWDASLETPDYVMLAVDLEEYATKAELQAETNQRKASDSRLEARLENLEQKAGDYSTVQYRGTDAVPTGKAKNGLVEKIVGKSRAWNQIQYNGNCASQDGWQNGTVSNGYIQGSANAGEYWQTYNSLNLSPIIQGHVYLTIARLTSVSGLSSGTTYFNLRINDSGSSGNAVLQTATSIADGASVMLQGIFTATSAHAGLSPLKYWGVHNDTNAHTQRWSDMIIRDLTLIFGAGNEPSTVADALAQLPALGQYNPYDAGSLVDTEVSGVKSVGVNIWDEEWDHIAWDASGSYYQAPGYIGSKNKIRVQPNTAYYFHFPASIISIIVWDANGNAVINGGIAHEYTMPSTAYEMVFFLANYSTDYNHDIQICLNSYADKTTYHPYKSDTLSLSEPVTLRGVGTCVETLDVETGVLDDGKFVLKNLGDYDWTQTATGKFIVNDSDVASNRGADVVPNIVCTKYSIITPTEQYQETKTGITTGGNGVGTVGQIRVYDASFTGDATAFKTAMSGVYLLCEKANYTPSDPIDPIPNNFIEVEGGGTIETVQEQSPVIDNCLDVGYLTL